MPAVKDWRELAATEKQIAYLVSQGYREQRVCRWTRGKASDEIYAIINRRDTRPKKRRPRLYQPPKVNGQVALPMCSGNMTADSPFDNCGQCSNCTPDRVEFQLSHQTNQQRKVVNQMPLKEQAIQLRQLQTAEHSVLADAVERVNTKLEALTNDDPDLAEAIAEIQTDTATLTSLAVDVAPVTPPLPVPTPTEPPAEPAAPPADGGTPADGTAQTPTNPA